ncbi:MAG: NAD-dependent dehydratase [Deltaproteobacteria bacterium HGW-Deltaproteobacteria-4]|nr:MAG: NAD-dependent dehydratase [Deltaproteobacteria bacterium HGW-Deltaproteobacteria-4]
MSEKTALITGGTGFVGSNLCRRLVQEGWGVHIIAIPNDNYTLLDDIKGHVAIHVHDGSTDCMNTILEGVKPDVVFHLASLVLSEQISKDIERLIVSNVLFGTQLLEAMASQGATKIVNTGTSWQHYENKSYSPVNLYAATKQAFEDILQYYVEAKGVAAITLKLFDTYGPNDPRPKLFQLLDKAAKEGISLAMSFGEQLIDLVHIDDVVQAFVAAAERLQSGVVKEHESFGVSSNNAIPLKVLVETYGRLIGKSLPIEWGGRPYRLREVMVPWSCGAVLPGWVPKIGSEEGMKQLVVYGERDKYK